MIYCALEQRKEEEDEEGKGRKKKWQEFSLSSTNTHRVALRVLDFGRLLRALFLALYLSAPLFLFSFFFLEH